MGKLDSLIVIGSRDWEVDVTTPDTVPIEILITNHLNNKLLAPKYVVNQTNGSLGEGSTMSRRPAEKIVKADV